MYWSIGRMECWNAGCRVIDLMNYWLIEIPLNVYLIIGF
jgi:hypothetical protein